MLSVKKKFKFYTSWGYHGFFEKRGWVYCFGRNQEGQCGVGSPIKKFSRPKRLKFFKDLDKTLVHCSTGEYHSVFLVEVSGYYQVFSTGFNKGGNLSLGDCVNRRSLNRVLLEDLVQIKKISAGSFASYFLSTDGVVYSAGNNSYGELGVGDTLDRIVGTKAKVVAPYKKIKDVLGGNYMVIFLTECQTILVAGTNEFGQQCSGGNRTNNDNTVPVELKYFRERNISVLNISLSSHTVYFLTKAESTEGKEDGPVQSYCCGHGSCGEFGVGNYTGSNLPVLSKNMVDIKEIAGGGVNFVVYRSRVGRVFAQGYNMNGECGFRFPRSTANTVSHYQNIPREIRMLQHKNICQIESSFNTTYFFSSDGEIFACGSDEHGQLMTEGEPLDLNVVHIDVLMEPRTVSQKSQDRRCNVKKIRCLEFIDEFDHTKNDEGHELLVAEDMEEIKSRLEFVKSDDVMKTFGIEFFEGRKRKFNLFVSVLANSTDAIIPSTGNNVMLFLNEKCPFGETFESNIIIDMIFGFGDKWLKKNPRNYLDLFLFCEMVNEREYCYVLLKRMQIIQDVKILVKLFYEAHKQLEDDVKELDIDEILSGDVKTLPSTPPIFKSFFTEFLFNVLSSRVEEIENYGKDKEGLVVAFEQFHLWDKLVCLSPTALDGGKYFQNISRQNLTFREVYARRITELYEKKELYHNFEIVCKDKKRLRCVKEILIVESEYFYRSIKFGGSMTRKEGEIHVSELDSEEMRVFLEYIHTKKMNLQRFTCSRACEIALKILSLHPNKTKETRLRSHLKQSVLEMTMNFNDVGEPRYITHVLPYVGYLFHTSGNVILSDDDKEYFISHWQGCFEEGEIERIVDDSFRKFGEGDFDVVSLILEKLSSGTTGAGGGGTGDWTLLDEDSVCDDDTTNSERSGTPDSPCMRELGEDFGSIKKIETPEIAPSFLLAKRFEETKTKRVRKWVDAGIENKSVNDVEETTVKKRKIEDVEKEVIIISSDEEEKDFVVPPNFDFSKFGGRKNSLDVTDLF